MFEIKIRHVRVYPRQFENEGVPILRIDGGEQIEIQITRFNFCLLARSLQRPLPGHLRLQAETPLVEEKDEFSGIVQVFKRDLRNFF